MMAPPPKPVSEEFLLLGDETRGSGEAQMVVDPTDAKNIIATGMGTWQAIPGCEAPDVNCKDFHNFPNSTWPVSAQTFDGGRTWSVQATPASGTPLRDIEFSGTATGWTVGAGVILFDPIFQGLAISLMAGEVASLFLSRTTVPIVYYMTHKRLRDRAAAH